MYRMTYESRYLSVYELHLTVDSVAVWAEGKELSHTNFIMVAGALYGLL